MWVKICGITRLEDALLAEELGADAVGFIFAPSPRQIDPFAAARIADDLHHVAKVGVFVNRSMSEIQEIRSLCHLDLVQLHGNESPKFCRSLGGTVIKALRVRDETSLAQIAAYDQVWKMLLDSYDPNKRGGTGKRINAELLRSQQDFSRIILAGGITPENVAELIGTFQPFGVDVSSGVENAPGIKDHDKLQLLFRMIQTVLPSTRQPVISTERRNLSAT